MLAILTSFDQVTTETITNCNYSFTVGGIFQEKKLSNKVNYDILKEIEGFETELAAPKASNETTVGIKLDRREMKKKKKEGELI